MREDTFGQVQSFTIAGARTRLASRLDYTKLNTLDLGGMPNLETILARNRSCYHVKTLELTRG